MSDVDDEVNAVYQRTIAPALKHYKDALKEQIAKLEREVQEKKKGLTDQNKKKEEIGAQLFTLQKEVATAWEESKKVEDRHEEAIAVRQQEEVGLKQVKEVNVEALREHAKESEKTRSSQRELDKINYQLMVVKQMVEEQDSTVKVSKREWSKGEEDAKRIEKAQASVDSQVQILDERIKHVEEETAVVRAQFSAQKGETEKVQKFLEGAEGKMDEIQQDKKKLLSEWRSCLLRIQHLDQAVKELSLEIDKEAQAYLSTEGEINNYRKAIIREQEKNELLTAQAKRFDGEEKAIQSRISNLTKQRESILEENARQVAILEKTEEDLRAVDAQAKELEAAVMRLKEKGDDLANKKVKIETEIELNLQSQKTIEKSSYGAKKQAKGASQLVGEKERQIGEQRNEIAAMQVDIQNIVATNQKLQEELQDWEEVLKTKDELIRKYEIEIKRRNDDIERKQSEVDRCNKRFDAIKANRMDENMGPLEAQIFNYQKELKTMMGNSQGLQSRWLRTQQELVSTNQEADKKAEELISLEREITVFERRQLRLQGQRESLEKDLRMMDGVITGLRGDMQKLNAEIAKHGDKSQEIQNQNLTLKLEFRRDLDDAERSAAQLLGAIEQLAWEKEVTLRDIGDAQRLTVMWKRKEKLAEEMRAALDPTVGASESHELQQEVKRLRAERDSAALKIQSLQTKLVQGVKRHTSNLEAGPSRKKAEQLAATVQSNIQKQAAELDRRINEAEARVVRLTAVLEQNKVETAALEEENRARLDQIRKVVEEKEGLEREAAWLREKANFFVLKTTEFQRAARDFATKGPTKAERDRAEIDSARLANKIEEASKTSPEMKDRMVKLREITRDS